MPTNNNSPFAKHPDDLVIKFVANDKYMVFSDGIDSFDRSYNIAWDSVNVYGRQDAIQTYQSTGETINLSWPLKPGTSPDEFNYQLDALVRLGKFVRPLYGSENGVDRIVESPLLLIKYRNLIVEEYNDNNGTPVLTPLLIAPNSLTINYGDRAREVGEVKSKLVVPKRISISLSGVVINKATKYYTVPVEFTPGEDGSEQQKSNNRNTLESQGR